MILVLCAPEGRKSPPGVTVCSLRELLLWNSTAHVGGWSLGSGSGGQGRTLHVHKTIALLQLSTGILGLLASHNVLSALRGLSSCFTEDTAFVL